MTKDLLHHFSDIQEPRKGKNISYSLESILFITVCAVFSGCTDWEEIEEYGNIKIDWLRRFVALPNGIPSHDTFNRIFAMLEPKQLQICFIGWVQSIVQQSPYSLINIDGKRLCNAGEGGKKSFIHLVNAWSSDNELILGQIKVDSKSNEITAIPQLLDLLELEGAIVSIDAMGCQTDIAHKIIEKQGNYLLAVKGNQGYLHDDLKEAFKEEKAVQTHTISNVAHGRIEKRTCSIIKNTSWISRQQDWQDVKSLVCIISERTNKQTLEMQQEQRFYIASFDATPQRMNGLVRGHWSIENQLHWSLDVIFNEDKSTKQAGNAAENMSLINKCVLSILKNDKTRKGSIKRKRNACGWDNEYLVTVLTRNF
jgi:predicted transposase YbfD/YdcC